MRLQEKRRVSAARITLFQHHALFDPHNMYTCIAAFMIPKNLLNRDFSTSKDGDVFPRRSVAVVVHTDSPSALTFLRTNRTVYTVYEDDTEVWTYSCYNAITPLFFMSFVVLSRGDISTYLENTLVNNRTPFIMSSAHKNQPKLHARPPASMLIGIAEQRDGFFVGTHERTRSGFPNVTKGCIRGGGTRVGFGHRA